MGVLLKDEWRQKWSQWLPLYIRAESENEAFKNKRQWQQELNELQEKIHKIEIEKNIEISIRRGLEQKIVDLQEQLKKAELQLSFVKSR